MPFLAIMGSTLMASFDISLLFLPTSPDRCLTSFLSSLGFEDRVFIFSYASVEIVDSNISFATNFKRSYISSSRSKAADERKIVTRRYVNCIFLTVVEEALRIRIKVLGH